MYSPELKDLVSKLLVKDQKKRPQVIDILRMPYVRGKMLAFVQNQGSLENQLHLTAPKSIQPAACLKLKQKDESELTAADRMKLRKEMRDIEKFEELKQAAQEAHINKTIGKQLEMQQFHQDTQNLGAQPMGTIKGGESTFGSDFDANNRTMGNTSSQHESSMRRDIEPHMQGKIQTDYNKPWLNKEEREAQNKDYLRQTN